MLQKEMSTTIQTIKNKKNGIDIVDDAYKTLLAMQKEVIMHFIKKTDNFTSIQSNKISKDRLSLIRLCATEIAFHHYYLTHKRDFNSLLEAEFCFYKQTISNNITKENLLQFQKFFLKKDFIIVSKKVNDVNQSIARLTPLLLLDSTQSQKIVSDILEKNIAKMLLFYGKWGESTIQKYTALFSESLNEYSIYAITCGILAYMKKYSKFSSGKDLIDEIEPFNTKGLLMLNNIQFTKDIEVSKAIL